MDNCNEFRPVPACVCGHPQTDHEYALFQGVEDYGQCSECGCKVFLEELRTLNG